MKKVIIQLKQLLLTTSLLLSSCIIYAQNTHPCRLILQFEKTVSPNDVAYIIQAKSGNILHSIIEKDLKIYLAEFELNNGDDDCFITIDDAYQYFDCGGGVHDQTNGSSTKVKSVDYEYNLTTPRVIPSSYSQNYDLYNYNPTLECSEDLSDSANSFIRHNVKIAVVDSGHENGSPFDYLIDYEYAYDFVDNDKIPDDATHTKHGTNVNSVIAGMIANFSPSSSKIKIIPIKILDAEGSSSLFRFYQGMIHAINSEPNIINLSIGAFMNDTDICTNIFDNILAKAEANNVLVVAAAGNDYTDIDNQYYIPSSSTSDNLIVVGSSSCDMNISSFSNIGAIDVDLFAIGENISVYPEKIASGTSFAAPQVSAIAAIQTSISPYSRPSYTNIKSAILESTIQQQGWENYSVSGGVLDLSLRRIFYESIVTESKEIRTVDFIDSPNQIAKASGFIYNDDNHDNTANVALQASLNAYFLENQMNLTIKAAANQTAQIKIVSLAGNVVSATNLSLTIGINDHRIVGLRQLPKGIYIVHMLMDNKELIVQKCFKNH